MINIGFFLAAMDGTNRLKFHFIDLYDAVVRSIQDPTLEGKLYHAFELQLDKDGLRMFDKANSGLVFESFQYLDVGAAPVIAIVASDASHQGNLKQHPMYCKSKPFLYAILFSVIYSNTVFLQFAH